MSGELDALLPAWDARSAHAVDVAASPAQIDAAIRALRATDLPVTGLLMGLRRIPARISGRGGGARTRGTLLEGLRATGIRPLVDIDGRGVVMGLIGQPWRLRGGRTVTLDEGDATAFARFAESGYVRAAVCLLAEPGTGPGRSRLRTETRVQATDPATRAAFLRYWRVIGPFSGVTRWEMLRAIRRRAEAARS